MDELVFFTRILGGNATDGESGDCGLHRDQVHLCLLAGTDEADDFGILAGQVLGGQCSHRADPHVGAERAFHEGNRKASFDL